MSPRSALVLIAVAGLAGGCGPSPGRGTDGGTTGGGNPVSTFTVGQWNLDWFGSTQYGPSDVALQQQNVTGVLEGHKAAIWALEEVVDTARLAQVASALGDGHLAARDNTVTGHDAYRGAQETAILYDPKVLTVESAKVVLGSDYYDFADRPPFVVAGVLHLAGGAVPVTFVVLHMKAYADQTSYDRRVAASKALKTWLDANHPSDRVFVVGDYNDDLDTSDYNGSPSPYANFVADTADYTFPTMVFTKNGTGTYVGDSNPIDHQMVTNELSPWVVSGSQTVIHPSIPSYRSTTSDHYPVEVSYRRR